MRGSLNREIRGQRHPAVAPFVPPAANLIAVGEVMLVLFIAVLIQSHRILFDDGLDASRMVDSVPTGAALENAERIVLHPGRIVKCGSGNPVSLDEFLEHRGDEPNEGAPVLIQAHEHLGLQEYFEVRREFFEAGISYFEGPPSSSSDSR